MSCNACSSVIEPYGADPAIVQWKVVRGDTSSLRIEFWENDETTQINTNGWTYAASARDSKTATTYELDIEADDNYVNIIALAEDTASWGNGYGSIINELQFDLQITKNDNTVWTPVVGTICVLGDVTGGSL